MGWPGIPFPGGSGTGFPTGGNSGNVGFGNNAQTWLQLLGLGSSVIGGILNRPKGLNSSQQRILDQLLAQLSSKANAPLSIDPNERNSIYETIAQSGVGARNRINQDFAGRGLSDSGLRGEELGRAERTMQSAQTAANLDLLRGARAERTQAQTQLQSLLSGIPAMQGASAAGVGLSSLGEVLGYLLTLNQLGRR